MPAPASWHVAQRNKLCPRHSTHWYRRTLRPNVMPTAMIVLHAEQTALSSGSEFFTMVARHTAALSWSAAVGPSFDANSRTDHGRSCCGSTAFSSSSAVSTAEWYMIRAAPQSIVSCVDAMASCVAEGSRWLLLAALKAAKVVAMRSASSGALSDGHGADVSRTSAAIWAHDARNVSFETVHSAACATRIRSTAFAYAASVSTTRRPASYRLVRVRSVSSSPFADSRNSSSTNSAAAIARCLGV
mmetsp:Transcript_7404/g.23154  ORF Transcript_7404/g.23154 Transcript_7404/m.23154 type:complete len:244 (-) Transcript_7404:32-763(-)